MPVLPPYNRFDCCLSLLVVRLLEHGFLFLNWSGRVGYFILSFLISIVKCLANYCIVVVRVLSSSEARKVELVILTLTIVCADSIFEACFSNKDVRRWSCLDVFRELV